MANNVILGYGKVLVVIEVTCGKNQRGSKNNGIRLAGESGVTNSRRRAGFYCLGLLLCKIGLPVRASRGRFVTESTYAKTS